VLSSLLLHSTPAQNIGTPRVWRRAIINRTPTRTRFFSIVGLANQGPHHGIAPNVSYEMYAWTSKGGIDSGESLKHLLVAFKTRRDLGSRIIFYAIAAPKEALTTTARREFRNLVRRWQNRSNKVVVMSRSPCLSFQHSRNIFAIFSSKRFSRYSTTSRCSTWHISLDTPMTDLI